MWGAVGSCHQLKGLKSKLGHVSDDGILLQDGSTKSLPSYRLWTSRSRDGGSQLVEMNLLILVCRYVGILLVMFIWRIPTDTVLHATEILRFH